MIFRTLENEICKYMKAISKNIYLNELSELTDKYSNTIYRSIKINPVDFKYNTYIDFDFEFIWKNLNLTTSRNH